MGKKVLMILGTRPEAIKMAPVFHALDKTNNFNIEICSTGQHKEMLDQVTKLFELPIHYKLNSMRDKQDLFALTTTLLSGLQETLLMSKPDCILVHGDTTSSMAAAMAGFYLQIPIGHVEAGLRTGRLDSPFPEEGNRRINSVIADWHFAPTEINRQNLLAEHVNENKIIVTGNTIVDALQMIVAQFTSNTSLALETKRKLSSQLGFDPSSKRIALVTCHRRENFGDGLDAICNALVRMAKTYPETKIVFPVHLNPNVRNIVYERLANIKNIHLLTPLSYEMFCYLLNEAYFVLTDSGGIQEEAPSLGKPVLVMRDTTERPEAVTAGTVQLVGANTSKIISAVDNLMNDREHYQRMARAHNPYGDGKASSRIASALMEKI